VSRLRVKHAVALVAATLVGTLGVVSGPANASTGTFLRVSKTGSDVGNCISKPCATINYALSQAQAGATIKVSAGTYNQTVAISKPIHLLGMGAKRTILNGAGLDPGGSFYGVVYVGTTGGAVVVSGFTITNPFPYAYTGGEPEAVALIDQNSSDSVVITKNVISEGSSDPTAGTDFPIAIDTFKNAATTTISHNTITGTFQGALLEDNGPASVSYNKITNLISGTDTSTTPPTVYPGEGVFFLSDLSGSITGQQASHNRLSGYGGWGIIFEAGYNNGNCTATPCNGSIAGAVSHNQFALKGATSEGKGTSAIDMKADFAGNNLTASVTSNRGYVTSPSQAFTSVTGSGATSSVSQSGNNIKVKP